MTDRPERNAVVSGIGQSDVGRRLMRDGLDLTVDAALRAIEDAGVTPADVDGLASYPGYLPNMAEFSGPGTPTVQDALRLELNWHHGGLEGPAQLSAFVAACLAVSAGLARHVLVYRTVTESSAHAAGFAGSKGGGAGGKAGAPRAGGDMAWLQPFGAVSAASWLAMNAQRHMYEFGTTREQLAQIALNGRRNAEANPNAIYRDPLGLDDYMAARMITTPFCLFDCDAPADGSTAVIVSHADYAPDAPHPAVRVEAVGTAIRGRPSWDQWDDLTTFACRDAAAQMWQRSDVTPADVDVAQLYDGFSFLTMAWLEALGFCGHGESGPFVEDGAAIARDGPLPLNTAGGQLSGGRLHGYGLLHEAVVQLRGDATGRQVEGAEVAVVATGGGPIAGCVTLTR